MTTVNIQRDYRMKEAIRAVLSGLCRTDLERVLACMTGEFDLKVEDSQCANESSIDGVGSPHIILIVKTEKNAIKLSQLKAEIELGSIPKVHWPFILVITPDDSPPGLLRKLHHNVWWVPFAQVNQATVEILSNRSYFVSDYDVSNLLELQNLMHDWRLADRSDLGPANDVVIVASFIGWRKHILNQNYTKSGQFVVCRTDESFCQAERLGFYSQGIILQSFPKILEIFEKVNFRRHANKGLLRQIVDSAVDDYPQWVGEQVKILQLSNIFSEDTLNIPDWIPNDLRSKNGQPVHFTLSHRFVSSEALKSAKTTSDLVWIARPQYVA